MKKIYSIVLMAVALLVCTNVNAKDVIVDGNDLAALKAAIAETGATGGKVTLTQPIVITADDNATWAGIWIGTENEDDAAQSITLDLAGNNITIQTGDYKKSGVSTAQTLIPFVITKGKLDVISSSPATIQVVKGTSAVSASTNVFYVFGTYDKVDPKGANPFSHLSICEHMTVQTENGTVIAVDALRSGGVNTSGSTTYISGKKTKNVVSTMAVFTALARATSYGKKPAYSTDYFSGNYGFANGALVEVKGALISKGNDATKCYGVKTNGYLAYSGDTKKTVRSGDLMFNWMSSYSVSEDDAKYAPFIHVYPSAKLETSNNKLSDASAAAYCSGYAQWLVEGTCEGAIGLYASSGDVNIDNATITSGATEYSIGTEAGHANGCGSAIVINSRDAYAGNIDITISGDTKVSSTSGYAVEEILNTSNSESKVELVAIEGGTFEGGKEGALVITETTAAEAVVTVAGGNVTGSAEIGTEDLADYLSAQGGTHATVVTDPETGKTTLVISEGDAPTGDANVAGHAADARINWTGAAETLDADVTLAVLEINQATEQKLTINDGVTLTVGSVVLGGHAQIIVEAGAKFIVTGEQGIVAAAENNLLLKNEGEKRSTFLFNPKVNSNRHPMAVVEMKAPKAYQIDANNYSWHRFASPVVTVDKIAHNYSAATYELYSGTAFIPDIEYWNYAIGDWKTLTSLAEFKPFQGYFVSTNITKASADATKGIKFTFTGRLQGNETDEIIFNGTNFNYFANSFTAPMSVESLLEQLETNGGVTKATWVWNAEDQGFEDWSLTKIAMYKDNNWEWANSIGALEEFVCQLPLTAAHIESVNVNYAQSVWAFNQGGAQSAPARRRMLNSNMTTARINVQAINGSKDHVTLIESADFSAEYENGSDAPKFMNSNKANLYISDTEKLGTIATDNLEGTLLSIQTRDAEQYTLSFSHVAGTSLAIQDMVTGIVTEIREGNTYDFVAEANADVTNRFKIINPKNAPTDVETIINNEKVKAVYTVLGQYVGTVDNLNSLPAGVYVIDGVKIVK